MIIKHGFVSNSSSMSFLIKSNITTSDLALIMTHLMEKEARDEGWKKDPEIKKAMNWLYKNSKFNDPIIIPWTINYETSIWANKQGICVDTCNNHRWWNDIEYIYLDDGLYYHYQEHLPYLEGRDKKFLDLSTLKKVYEKDFVPLYKRPK